jgi:hypothetical protein
MVDWVQRIHRHRSEDLEPGEHVRAAAVLQPAGNSRRLAAGSVGGLLGVLVASRLRRPSREPSAPEEGIASRFPDGTVIVGATEARLLVFGQSAASGRPTELRLALDRGDIASIEVDKGLFRDVTVVFADGTRRRFETPGPDKGIDRLVAELS